MHYSSYVTRHWISVFALFFIGGCTGFSIDKSAENTPTENEPTVSLIFTNTTPFSLGASSAYYVQDHSYGSDAAHKLDIFLPTSAYDSGVTTPLVIFIHGGGFTSGAKEDAWASGGMQTTIRTLLANGIAFASIQYPLLSSPDSIGIMKSLGASKRALQYLRYYSKSFNLKKDKVSLMGTSAGSSTALWLGLHDDMADAGNVDPVLRQSTRVSAVVGSETQGTLDLVYWETIFASYGFSLSTIASTATNFYAASAIADLTSQPEKIAIRNDVHFLSMMDSSDPEIWISNDNVPEVAPSTTSILYHHPYHAKALYDRAASVGLAGVFYIPELGISDASGETVTPFLLRKAQ